MYTVTIKNRIMQYNTAISFVVVAGLLEGIIALRCYTCNGILEPQYCVKSAECATGEICYTEQVIDDDLNVFYNTGCKQKNLCDIATLDGFGKRTGQLHVCEKCCNTEKCNTVSCRHTNVTGPNRCLRCSDVARPSDCNVVVECRKDEICFTQEFVNDQYLRRYNLGCETAQRCQLLNQLAPQQRSTQLCNQCCAQKNCNKYLCEDSKVGTQSSGSGITPDLNSIATTRRATTHRPLTHKPTTTTSRPTTARAGPTTQPTPCEDSTVINCADLNVTGNLCSPGSAAAARYCPKFCKLC